MRKLKGTILTKEYLDNEKAIRLRIVKITILGVAAGVGLVLSYTWIFEQLNIK